MHTFWRLTTLTTASVLLTGFILGNISPQVSTASSFVETDKLEVVSIRAAGPNAAHVKFADSKELRGGNADSQRAGSPPMNLVSADFDSDGIPDLVTADQNGELRFYRGNRSQHKSNSPKAGALRADLWAKSEFFSQTEKTFSVTSAPDFLFAGDFNADGHKDILAANSSGQSLNLLAGDGAGSFAPEVRFEVGGAITALEAGEIGREDGQTDVAVAITKSKGSLLLVFEHPEGAFKHGPEIIKLATPATSIAIGNLDADTFADIAVSGNAGQLTVVHGRGQAYPWDMMKEHGIVRPAAVIERRQMPFQIAALAVGRFTERRGSSLAMLAEDGQLHALEAQSVANLKANSESLQAVKTRSGAVALVPNGADAGRFAAGSNVMPTDPEAAAQLGLMMADSSAREDSEKASRVGSENAAAEMSKRSAEERRRLSAEASQRDAGSRQRSKANLLKSISARPGASLANWNLRPLVAQAQLTNAASSAASSSGAKKLIPAHVSGSGSDDLILLDGHSRRIQIVSQIHENKDQQQAKNTNRRAEIVSLEAESSPTAVLATRLNADAMSDLIVLREGSQNPSVVMSEPANTIVVNTLDDTDDGFCFDDQEPCSLRRAILTANQLPGPDLIAFDLFGATLTLSSELPAIREAVTIDGTTDPTYAGKPVIEIKGSNISGAADGLKIESSFCVVRGLAINEFPSIMSGGTQIGGNGITVVSTNFSGPVFNNTIEFNYIGTDLSGNFDKGNDAAGVNIYDSDSNAVHANVISGNGSWEKRGAGIAVTNGDFNLLVVNIIGLNAGGNVKVGNSSGIFLTGRDNSVGYDAAGAANTISGNGEVDPSNPAGSCRGAGIDVIQLFDTTTGALLTGDNIIIGNRIGTDVSGTVGLGNCSTGITTTPIVQTVIGSITQAGRNLVSGNHNDAVWCIDFYNDPGGFCRIAGNDIGTDMTGTKAIPNDEANSCAGLCPLQGTVWVSPAPDTFSFVGAPGGTIPGGACTGFCNLISGNDNEGGFPTPGIHRSGSGTVDIFNNYVGTNRIGQAALPNSSGVSVYFGQETNIGATLTGEGGSPVSGGNLISGNKGTALSVSDTFTSVTAAQFKVKANLIGTNAGGDTAIPNNPTGGSGSNAAVRIHSVLSPVELGGTGLYDRNVISGNGHVGVEVFQKGAAANVSIVNNYIGVGKQGEALGNSGSGISLSGVGTIVGGDEANLANLIQNNGGAGVLIYLLNDIPAYSNQIRGNSIFNNGGLGIDLTRDNSFPHEPDGVTANDCLDSDSGANDLQNYPELSAPTINDNGTVTVEGALRSSDSQTYTLQFYANTSADPTNYGEGETFIGAKSVTTDGNGFVSFTFTSTAQVGSNKKITATATDSNGNTSEFSCAAGECTSGGLKVKGDFRASVTVDPPDAGPTCAREPIVVNNTTDDPDKDPDDTLCDTDGEKPGLQCSLRAAIMVAEGEAHPGRDTIKFNIPGEGVHTIAPTTLFKRITQPLTIDGTSQPGYNGSPLIELSGANIPEAASPVGLDFQSGSGFSRVEGLALHSWFLASIGFRDSENSQVVGCYIGLQANGVTTPPNQFRSTAGIWVNSKNIQIQGNVISHNESGIRLGVAYRAIILENKIGTDKTGLIALPNSIGIEAGNGFAAAEQGFHQIEKNLISGNEVGISIGLHGGGDNRIHQNLIGTTPDALKALPNSQKGIIIANSINNVIEGNTISGHIQNNFSAGIFLNERADKNQIYDNKIGIGVDGTTVIPNRYGIIIESSSLNQIGVAGKVGNKISGNTEAGVYISDSNAPNATDPFPATQNTIINNHIGIAAGNKDGIRLDRGAQNNEISGNSISNNASHGVLLLKDADSNQIHDNRIGTLAANKIGVGIKSSNNSIYTNTISGNTDYNMVIGYVESDGGFSGNAFVQGNAVYDNQIENSKIGLALSDLAKNNRIGVDGGNKIINHKDGAGVGIYLGASLDFGNEDFIPSGNEFYRNRVGEAQPGSFSNKFGMVITKARNNIIGSATSGLGNLFLASAEDGIFISGSQTTGNQITGNFIGFDLESPGVSASGNGGNGILVDGALGNQIIKNRIGYNRANGISVTNLSAPTEDAVTITITGNDIGAVQPADQPLIIANGADGIKLDNVQNALIGVEGNSSFEPRNVIAANVGHGISIRLGSSNRINHSLIGTPRILNENFGNGGDGIRIRSGGRANTIGGASGVSNSILYNRRNGINIDSSHENKIYGNQIGVSGKVKAGNGLNGIRILHAGHTAIGQRGFINNFHNIIGGNAGSGILIEASAFTTIENNHIGTNSTDDNLGNELHGIFITDGTHSTNVGGRGVETGNTIAFNGTQRALGGVVLDSTAGRRNLIDPNRIFGNAGMGIDIGAPGTTLNDFGDADEGANRLQNFPEIISRSVNTNNELVVSYRMTSAPGNSAYGTEGIYIEFFRADATGQGEKFLGFDHYTAGDYNNGSPIAKQINLGNITTLGINANDPLTATATDAEGNTSEFMPLDTTPPTTPPAVNFLLSQAANEAGWHNGNVTITLNAVAPEGSSGVQKLTYTATGAQVIGSTQVSGDSAQLALNIEGETTVSFFATDNSGNSGEPQALTIKLDKTKPTIQTSRTAANSQGWNNTNVEATYTASDGGGSGLASPATGSHTFTVEGTNQSHTFTVTDMAGNSETATVGNVNIDKTAPAISTTRTPANSNGWNKGNVVATYTATDTLSGLSSGAPASGTKTFTAEGANQSHTFTMTDKAGNTSSATVGNVNIDKTAPTISSSAATSDAKLYTSGIWTRLDVTVSFVCTDGPSGVAGLSAPATITTEGANQSVAGVCVDRADNSSKTIFGGINIDKTAPVITITQPTNGAGYTLNQKVAADYGCTDNLLLANCNGTVADNRNLDTSTPGAKTFTVTSTDSAGNTATTTVNYTVAGYLIKTLYDTTKAHKSGSTIPIKLQITNGSNVNLSSANIILHALNVIRADGSTYGPPEDSGKSNPAGNFRFTGDAYHFNLKTTGYPAGTYLLQFTVGSDPHIYTTPFKVR